MSHNNRTGNNLESLFK